MDKNTLNDSKLFEKIEIQWFSVEDMIKKRSQFRNFYQEIVDLFIDKKIAIEAFAEKKSGLSRPKYRDFHNKTHKQRK
jgi:hypothetical protein